MANHKSAKKRAKQSETRRQRNAVVKTKMKNAIKSLTESSVETVGAAMTNVQSVIAKSAKKGVIHKKTAARKTSRLAKMMNRMSA